MSILVVDDDPDIRDTLQILLESEGHTVEQAADGTEALAQLESGRTPSVILLDLMMPGLDGESFIKSLRRDPAIANIPIIILSGHQAAKQIAEDLGVAGVLVKPIEFDALTSMIERALR
jgi:CheY-like chemotaxis protein